MIAIVCRPSVFLLRRITRCPVCERPRQFAGSDAAWYGTTWSCCGCGDSWTDGEMHPRPFARGWRKKAINAARRTWIEAIAFDPREHKAWVTAEITGGGASTETARQVVTVSPAGGVL